MLLRELLQEIGRDVPFGGAEIVSVTDIVEEVRPGSLFVAVEGGRNDGHLLVRQALARGAAAVVTGRPTGAEHEIVVEDPRKVLGLLCAGFYGHPDRRMKLIGITGTNGKTTTAEYLKTLLERTGRRCGVIGTLGCGAGEERTETGYTTPGAPAFFAALRRMADAGCGYCAAEVSSQALSQYRVEAATFSLGVLTNLGRDHLDYHGTPAAYAEAKSRLFRLSEAALLNADDACLGQMAAAAEGKTCFTYSVKRRDADFCVTELWETSEGFDFTVAAAGEQARLRLPAVCGFTVYNALAAVAAAALCGVPLRQAAAALDPLPEVKGRMQRISGGGITVYIDFAHTPEALSGALRGLRRTEGRVITVFGCGGGRDRGKRPRMGRAAAALSDAVIVTSDNPREEAPEAIIGEILSGVADRDRVTVEPDRERAITLAVGMARQGDRILIAGKGHEEYQIVSDQKIPFSDEAVVRRLLGAGR